MNNELKRHVNNEYKKMISDCYKRIKNVGGVITNDFKQWGNNINECDDIYYIVNHCAYKIYKKGVKEISVTPKFVKLILNNDKAKYIKKG